MTEQAAIDAGLNVKEITINDNYRPEFMPTFEKALLKVVYEEESGRIVGADHATIGRNTFDRCSCQFT
jgi:pyruvate/2-oxoglutarate dehydrogenase complex dihydrolipoamide dehydrogenase (E3) component